MTHNCDACGRKIESESDRSRPTDMALCAGCLAAMLEQVFGVGRKDEADEPPLPHFWDQARAAV
jgi:hypothetical protein